MVFFNFSSKSEKCGGGRLKILMAEIFQMSLDTTKHRPGHIQGGSEEIYREQKNQILLSNFSEPPCIYIWKYWRYQAGWSKTDCNSWNNVLMLLLGLRRSYRVHYWSFIAQYGSLWLIPMFSTITKYKLVPFLAFIFILLLFDFFLGNLLVTVNFFSKTN